MKKITILLVFILNILTLRAQDSVIYNGVTIFEGDLLFVGAESENLSGAINRVTQRSESISFDHVGLIEIAEGIPYILHASSRKGSVKEPLDSLSGEQLYVIYRIDSQYRSAIPEAITKANRMLGKPYNWSYKLNDSTYYCSDFVERAFRHVELFVLEPMTFKNPKTGDFDDFWIGFYAKQGLAIPEGELGCNPNGLASNPKLSRIGLLRL
ncbi:YiiX/YebB-like N1pC/P60 family cysteine hydrolase [Sphingobacterium luzhongxinii]|uniref:YiiX/YebB-like N1pC/P60 family cysteine hydrolase n=1 Tax=Sphingobacterium luzhongxinii TaxID=2654181 RepID=UPI001969F1DB|nr:YiiX/YebB-like N1pC/P60 family cysteine hydrolase [Sphingobacterium sp. xlx-73]